MASVSDAAASGDQLKLLYAMRERLAEMMDDDRCLPRDVPPLTNRLQNVAAEIASIEEKLRLEGKGSGRTGARSAKADEFDETGS